MKLGTNFDHDITFIFVTISDFCNEYEIHLAQHLIGKTPLSSTDDQRLALSEIMTILVMYQYSNLKTFKYFYDFLKTYLHGYFMYLPSYNRFIELMKRACVPLTIFAYFNTGKKTGIYYIDSTKLPACEYKRSGRNKVFKDIAGYGKTSVCKFFGMKLHIIINDKGELIAFQITAGNVHDTKPIDSLSKEIKGKLFGDKGYIGKNIAERLLEKGLEVITKVRKNMKKPKLNDHDKVLLNQRSIVETVIGHLKVQLNIWHTRHRSVLNAMTHLMAALCCYCINPLKINITKRMENKKEPFDLQSNNLITN